MAGQPTPARARHVARDDDGAARQMAADIARDEPHDLVVAAARLEAEIHRNRFADRERRGGRLRQRGRRDCERDANRQARELESTPQYRTRASHRFAGTMPFFCTAGAADGSLMNLMNWRAASACLAIGVSAVA